MITFINSHQQALGDHSNVYKNANASEAMQNAEMYNATTKPRKLREEQINPTKLTKEKSTIKKGNKPQAPLASEQKCPVQAVW